MGVETWVLGALTVLLAAWAYSRWRHSYWASKGVPSPPAIPFIGHLHIILANQNWIKRDEIYKKYGDSPYFGLYEFHKPILFVSDPNMLKHIFVKDFDFFVNRRSIGERNKSKSLMGQMLSNRGDEEWKNLRAIMTPAFTSGKIRQMFPIVSTKADQLVAYCLRENHELGAVNIKDKFGRFALDSFASCAFGIECNSFGEKEPAFAKVAAEFFNFRGIKLAKFMIAMIAPTLLRMLGIITDTPEVKFFREVAEETISARKLGSRGDFLDLMMEVGLNDTSSSSKKQLTHESILAQTAMFLLRGYDTPATTLTFAAYLLAQHPHYQERLRKELRETVNQHGGLTYQGVMEAKFLDACFQETLRIFPPGSVNDRECNKTYQLPGSDLIVNKGDLVMCPIYSLHHDPKYWPEPEKFLPDRFMPENKANIVPYTHLPFGVGPRNCITMRFALVEMKVALSKLVLATQIELVPGEETLKMNDSPIILGAARETRLAFRPIVEE